MIDPYSMSANPQLRKIIRLDEVLEMTGLSKTQMYAQISKDEFPRQVPLGARAVGWYEDAVQDWIRRRDELRDTCDCTKRATAPKSRPEHNSHGGTRAASKSSGVTTSRPEGRPRNAKAKKNGAASPITTEFGGESTCLERIGTTSDGREMLWDRGTGNVLLVIGHLPSDYA